MPDLAPVIDPAAPLRFLVNGRPDDAAAQAKVDAIRGVLAAAGRAAEVAAHAPDTLDGAARAAAGQAAAAGSAVVAVGGDGTLSTVAQAAHAVGCPFGAVAQGTFNYFARSHGLPTDLEPAVRAVLSTRVEPVRVAAVNDRLFLVNASLGLYPELLEDRESWKARFGRSRVVAIGAAVATLLRAQRSLRIRVERGDSARDLRTLTLFVGSNRLQLEQVGVRTGASGTERTCMTAVMLRPIGPLGLLGLALRGAMGTLGDADSVERFDSDRMRVDVAMRPGRGTVKVAFDGEVAVMRPPLDFRLLDRPLWLVVPPPAAPAPPAGAGADAP